MKEPELYSVVKTSFDWHPEEIEVIFVIDPPHIIKRLRNCWFNSYNNLSRTPREMKVNGHPIKWQHMADVYKFDSTKCRTKITRLRKEHIYINPRTAINTKLANQMFNVCNLNVMTELDLRSNSSLVIRFFINSFHF
jgi:hypothetical protein